MKRGEVAFAAPEMMEDSATVSQASQRTRSFFPETWLFTGIIAEYVE